MALREVNQNIEKGSETKKNQKRKTLQDTISKSLKKGLNGSGINHY